MAVRPPVPCWGWTGPGVTRASSSWDQAPRLENKATSHPLPIAPRQTPHPPPGLLSPLPVQAEVLKDVHCPGQSYPPGQHQAGLTWLLACQQSGCLAAERVLIFRCCLLTLPTLKYGFYFLLMENALLSSTVTCWRWAGLRSL